MWSTHSRRIDPISLSAKPFCQGEAVSTGPADPKKDQVTETRRVLREMNDKADRAVDDQVGRSTPMRPTK
jgi:hypothetical protein